MKWPTEYTIKSRTWIIEYVPKEHDALREGDGPEDYALGICRADQRKIWICTDQDEDSMRDTLVHELHHAAYSTTAKPLAEDDDQAEHYEENHVLTATEAFFEIVNNSATLWWLKP